jgi:hypothetical protein
LLIENIGPTFAFGASAVLAALSLAVLRFVPRTP